MSDIQEYSTGLMIYNDENCTIVQRPDGLRETYYKYNGLYTHEYKQVNEDNKLIARKEISPLSAVIGRHKEYSDDGEILDDCLINFLPYTDPSGNKGVIEVGYYDDSQSEINEEHVDGDIDDGYMPQDYFEIAHKHFYDSSGLIKKMVYYCDGKPRNIYLYNRFEQTEHRTLDNSGKVIFYEDAKRTCQFRNGDIEDDEENEPWDPYGFELEADKMCDLLALFKTTCITEATAHPRLGDGAEKISYFDNKGSLLFREEIDFGIGVSLNGESEEADNEIVFEENKLSHYAICLRTGQGDDVNGVRILFDTNTSDIIRCKKMRFRKHELSAPCEMFAIFQQNNDITLGF